MPIRSLFVVLVVIAGCSGPGTPPGGAACTTSEQCEESSVCVLGRCRTECTGYRDCPLGSRCLLDADGELSGCRLPDEHDCAAATDCAEGSTCEEGRCIASCASSATCGGTECLMGACDEPDTTRVSCDDLTYCASGICDDVDCDEDVALVLGGSVTCSLRGFGEVDCAGSDRSGTLGDGATEHENGVRAFLQPVILADQAQAIAAGAEHACALLVTGEVDCWGLADRGQVGAPGAAGNLDVPGMTLDAETDDARAIVEMVAGMHHTCVRRASGAIECWGDDGAGQLGDDGVHPACGASAACSIDPVLVAGLTDAIQLDAGESATCAVREDGAVACWGRADTGLFAGATAALGTCTAIGGATFACRTTPLDVPGIEGATSVAVGAAHACAIDQDGVVWCWGASESGQAGSATAIAAPAMIVLPIAAAEVDAGRAHTCALLVDDRVWCWGANDQAQRGDETTATGARASQVPGLPRCLDVAVGADHACARTTDGEIWCWGRDAEAQLADGLADGSSSSDGNAPARRALRTTPGGP